MAQMPAPESAPSSTDEPSSGQPNGGGGAGRTALAVGLAVLAALVVILVVMWLVPYWWIAGHDDDLTDSQRLQRMNEARVPIAAGLAAIGTVVTLYYTSRAYSVSRSAMEVADRAQRETARLAEQGQNIDRYNNAVVLLSEASSEKLHARLGGIYALEGLATDSSRYRQTVADVLCAFIRHRSHAERDEMDTIGRVGLAVDVQAACTVLTRVSRLPAPEDEPIRVDLAGARLEQANLVGARFPGAHLRFAHLEQADLTGADLRGANLEQATMTATVLRDGQLDGARMAHTVLHGADLRHVSAVGLKARSARLQGADLEGACFRDARLIAARFAAAVPGRRPIRRDRADRLYETDFMGATLDRASFDGLDLRRTISLETASREHATFRGCALPDGLEH